MNFDNFIKRFSLTFHFGTFSAIKGDDGQKYPYYISAFIMWINRFDLSDLKSIEKYIRFPVLSADLGDFFNVFLVSNCQYCLFFIFFFNAIAIHD